MTDIRKACNQARALIDEQINPNEHKKTAKAQAYAAAKVEVLMPTPNIPHVPMYD